MEEEYDYLGSEASLLEMQNKHKIIQNMRNISDIAELSTYVNHLVFLHVYRFGTWIVPMEKYTVHVPKLGKELRRYSFL